MPSACITLRAARTPRATVIHSMSLTGWSPLAESLVLSGSKNARGCTTQSMSSPSKYSKTNQATSARISTAPVFAAKCTACSHLLVMKSSCTLASRLSLRISLLSKTPFSGIMILMATAWFDPSFFACTTHPNAPRPTILSAEYNLRRSGGSVWGDAASPFRAFEKAATKDLCALCFRIIPPK